MNWAIPCAPLGLTALGLNRLSFQISRTKGIGGRPRCLGLLLHERAHDIDEGLWSGEGESGLLDPRLDTGERTGLPARCRGREQDERRQEADCR